MRESVESLRLQLEHYQQISRNALAKQRELVADLDKAEAEEKQARDAYYEKDAELARCEGELARAEAARDALAAELKKLAEGVLDRHMPGWRTSK